MGFFSICCFEGKIHLPELPRRPDGLTAGQRPMVSIMSYENGLAFTSLGGKFEPHQASEQRPSAFANAWT
ncbi:BQ2448_2298 [Microbotryum intermedium]|uniref:BQ2448_2298 protein n=1 Tax=Microbotryum intermedium TaxID=269621 RepID=A0A238FDQ8_9BASI|nr:BQ2448_2298 [Microbotryum intermedium]